MNVKLYENLLNTFELILRKMGIWPSKQIPLIRVIIMAILSIFCILLIIKSSTHFERESSENSVANGLGALMMVLFFVRLTWKESEFIEIVNFIKDDLKRIPSDIEKEILDDIGKEIQTILKIIVYIFPMSIIGKLIMPFLQFAYGFLMREEDLKIIFPPPMGLPSIPLPEPYGDTLIYIIECSVRMIMLFWLLGAALLFIVTSLYICCQYRTLAGELENISIDDEITFNSFIVRHEMILEKARKLTNLYSTHFLVDSAVSYINLAVLLLSMFATKRGILSFLNDMLFTLAGGSQYTLIVIYGAHIMEASLLISESAYKVDWIGKSIKQQKKLLFLLLRSQTPTTLAVYENFGIASIEFFGNIIRNSYAAFNILQQTIRS